MNVHFSSQRLDWKTPKAVYQVLDAEFHFDHDPCPPKHQVNHRNGVRTDNNVENLEWVTSQENTLHGWKRGRIFTEKMKKAVSSNAKLLNKKRWNNVQ